MPLVRGPGGQVERRFAVRCQHEERLTRLELLHAAPRDGEGQRAEQAAGVDDRHNPIVPAASYRLAAVLAAGTVERFYSGLSLLVSSAAAGGAPCAGLATFRALGLLLDPNLLSRAGDPEATPGLVWAGRGTFARSLLDLRETALVLDNLELYACAASVDTMGLTTADVEERLRGVMSMPRFLRETEGAELVFV